VFRLAYRLTGNVHDAEDLAQEAFVRVFRALGSFQPGNLDAWIHRITVNLFYDQVRHNSKIRMEPVGEDAERVSDSYETPERQFEMRNLDRDVQQALDSLSPEFRVVVVLCDIQGLSYEEIAEITGCKIGTVRSRIHRARAQLRVALAHRAATPAEPTAAPGRKAGRSHLVGSHA
jgi:RNA polymerase sigma-70 factor (ECF subfamily)